MEDRNGRPTYQVMKVHELLNEEITLNEELVRCVVPPTDAESVLQIPIPVREVEDRLIWPHTDEGRVLAKSAYHRIRVVQDDRATDSYRNEDRTWSVWSAIWKNDMLSKVNSFMWSLMSDSLPVMKNLHRRGMNVQMSCPVCGEVEEREHMAYKCEWTEAIWFGIMLIGATHHTRSNIK